MNSLGLEKLLLHFCMYSSASFSASSSKSSSVK
nr:MAG TPA: hypothetical protein [Caudoviricetes sp.]